MDTVEVDTTTTDYAEEVVVADESADYSDTIQEGDFRLVLNPYSDNPYEGRAERYGYSENT